MKNIVQNINKAFDHRIRLGIMSILMVNESADFNTLKELLGVTDGNLASHTKALESENYIQIEKQFISLNFFKIFANRRQKHVYGNCKSFSTEL